MKINVLLQKCTICVLLIVLILSMLPAATACAQNGNSNGTTATLTEAAATTAEETLPLLDVIDCDGAEVIFLWPQQHVDGHFMHNEIYSEKISGDIIDDAIYSRNVLVEEAYGVTITSVLQFCSTIPKTVQTEFAAGEASYDALCTNIAFMMTVATGGVLADFRDLKYYDETQPWWDHELMQDFSVANRRYFALGDMIYSDNFYPYCIYVNTDLAETVGINESFYDLVVNKEWTLDKLFTLASSGSSNLDGNDVMDTNDRFGLLAAISYSMAIYYSSGHEIVSTDNDGYPTWEMTAEVGQSVLEKCVHIFHDDGVTLMPPEGVDGLTQAQMTIKMFNNNQAVFAAGELIFSERLTNSNSDIDYLILPSPLYDENSTEYICELNDAVVISVPAASDNQERTSLILSAMSRESVNTLTPAFFETVLKYKYLDNPDSVRLLEIILDSTKAQDVASIQDWGTFKSGFKNLVKTGSDSFTSFYSTRIKIAESSLNRYIKDLEALN